MLANSRRLPRALSAAIGLLTVAGVGAADYLTGHELLFSSFYLLGVSLGTWFVGRWFGFCISVIAVTVSLGGDLAAGARFSNPLIVYWNGVIGLTSYLVVVWLLSSLRSLQLGLEQRVRERTAALSEQMAERERLEREILGISEREQRRIGHDLHDGLCQHLTGTALAGQVLQEKLAAKSWAEASDARKLVVLVEEGITLARNLARGLHPVDMDGEGFMFALREMAVSASGQFRVACEFECNSPVTIQEAATATNLYRITQEALMNAVRHGQARHVTIGLFAAGDSATLSIADDGVGLPEQPLAKGPGLGIRIMAYRANLIGAVFDVRRRSGGGTIVSCSFRTGQLPSAEAV
jgi:signal transduction histidine kinase